jgi:hypothetical protein
MSPRGGWKCAADRAIEESMKSCQEHIIRKVKNMKKPEIETRRLTMALPVTTLKKIDDWRRKEPDLPNVSEALRRLIERGLVKQPRGTQP